MSIPLPSGCVLRAIAVAFASASLTAAQSALPVRPGAGDDVIKLEEFSVTSTQSAGYRATNAITATGIGAKIGDTPLAISVITSDLMKDTEMFEMREALNLVPGVLTNPRSESGVVIRGFGGLISYRNGQYRRQLMTTWNMDRIEVIKGPAAIFFGAVRPGGIVNNVTTKPVFSGTFTDVKATVGNEGFLKGEVFHNEKLGDKLAVRVGVGGLDVDGERSFEYRHEYYLGLSAIWKPTANQQITFDVEGINRRTFYLSAYPVRALANSKVFGAPGAITTQSTLNRQNTTADTANRAYLTTLGFSGTVGAANFYPLYDMFAPYGNGDALAHDATQWQEGQALDLDYLLRIGDNLVWQTTLNYAFDDTAGIQPADGDVRPYADGTVRFRVEDFINIRDSYNVHNKLTWRLDLGSTKHTLQFAQEYQRVIFTRPGYLNAANQYVDSPGNTGAAATNPYVTGFRPGQTAPVSLRSTIRASGQTFSVTRDREENNAGYYIVDQARLFNDRLFLLGGVRYNKFTGSIDYDKPVSNSSLSARSPGGLTTKDVIGAKGSWTPQYGGLVKVLPGLGAFATYSKSIEPNFQLDADGVASEPVESESLDFGLKGEFFGGRLASTLAYYDIKRANLSYRDTPREIATGRAPFYVFGNEEASEGIELDVNWSPNDNYQLIGGWSHVTKAETTRSNNATFVGRRFGGIPDNTYVIWNRYTFDAAPLQGLTLGLGVRRNDDTNLSQDPNNIVRLPAFTVWDAMAAYRFRTLGRNLRVQLNVKNLADKLYREGGDGFFAQRRTFFLSVSTRL
jgi:iron complex outermembrane receptor protein